MATFLDLTNAVLTRLNEVQLNSTTFGSASGFHLQAQQAVLDAIREINSDEYKYPWQHVTETQVLTPGTRIYPIPATWQFVDWDTFYIDRDDAIPVAAKSLRNLDYTNYVQSKLPTDLQASAQAGFGIPDWVVQDQSGNFIVSRIPDKAYTVKYEGWLIPTDLVAYNDVCPIPDRYRQVILNGSMYYAYLFRENIEAAGLIKQKFEDGVKDIRRQVGTPMNAVRDTRAGPQFTDRFTV